MVRAIRITLAATAAALAFATPAGAGRGPAPSEPKRSGPTAGDPCNDPDKLTFDPLLGALIVCDGYRKKWSTGVSGLVGTFTTGTSCDEWAPWTLARSSDSYLIWCYPASGMTQAGVPTGPLTWELYSP
jgi:hypothetical protein